MDFEHDNSGVSPVIGVILMVAVTVALVALVTVIVFDIGGDVSESPDATVDIAANSGSSVGYVNATLLRNENVDSFTFQSASTDATTSLSSTAGSTAVLTNDTANGGNTGTALPESGTVQVVATMSDGSEQVLTSADYDFS